ncbi:aldehyde-activating protein [Motiliproteus sp. MSK22-1]|nr:GFA family protein [Motiliproteus sp. MSK22-1]OMH33928.1 aldehyde-activating protein [Motiliproteus sp. MSK22-1]
MSETVKGHGNCLCGAVSFTVGDISKNMGACHCDTCRKWGGGPFLAVECGTDVTFGGEDNISVFNSSEWAQRGFCKQCGTHLFYRLLESQEYILPAGLFADDEQFQLDHQVFIDQKPSNYCFSNDTKNMTGAEVFAMYAPPAE